MALISSKDTKRLAILHEPGQWVEVRPLTAGDVDGLDVATSGMIRIALEKLADVIIAWSYDEPPSLDAIKRLDLDTFLWLGPAALRASGVRDDDEKKGSDNGSSVSPTPEAEQPPEPSLTRLPISSNAGVSGTTD